MAVSTNLGLYLPTVDDFITVARDLTGNYEIIDAAVGANTLGVSNLRSAFGFVEDGDVATHAIAAGQYLLWKGSLYIANSAISVGAAISGKVSAVTKGAVNDLRDKVVQLGSQTLTNTQKNQVKSNLGIGNMVGATSGTAGQAGFAPAPAAGKQGQFLRGDGTWTDPATMTGATSNSAGTKGLVPAPGSGKQGQYLRGDGTWNTPTNTTYSNFGGASSSAAGSSGLVPAPSKGYQGRFLRGDGTWAIISDQNTWRAFTVKSYNYEYSIDANSNKYITGSNLGVSTPSGYTAVAVQQIQTGNANVVPLGYRCQYTGSDWVLFLRNLSNSSQSGRAYINILYLQNGQP